MSKNAFWVVMVQ